MSLQKLFEKGDTGARILIEGDPGIGKTTLCHKLIHDFSATNVAENEKYFVHNLLFVFVIEMRNFSGSIKETIQKSLSMTQEEVDEMWRLIQTQSDKCLFIIDGLDEKRAEFPAEIQDLIEGIILTDCFVLGTCRTNEANKFAGFFHKVAINVGFTRDQAFQYVHKYFSHVPTLSNSIDEVIQFLEDQEEVLGDLLKTPLNCLLLCLWLEEWMTTGNSNPSFLRSKRMTTTNFYEMVVRSFLKRYCNKKGIQLHRGKLPEAKKEEMVKLYKLALFGILKEKYKFTVADLQSMGIREEDEILNLGFVSREYSVSALEEEEDVGYSFPHRSIQDFFAAKAIGHLSDPVTRSLVAYFGKYWKIYDHVCLFLCGLLKDLLLLKWLFCCNLENSADEIKSPHYPHCIGYINRDHTFTDAQLKEHLKNKRFINNAFEKAEQLTSYLPDIICGRGAFEFVPLSDIEPIANSYQPPGWIWQRTETGKLKDVLFLCLRGLYEVCPDEAPLGPSLLTKMIDYLVHMSYDKAPGWSIIDEYPGEIQFVIAKLWRQVDCSEPPLSKERRFQLQATPKTSAATWMLVFEHSELHVQELELSYTRISGLVKVLKNLGPQLGKIESLRLACDSGMVFGPGREDAAKRKEIEQRNIAKGMLSEMVHLKKLLVTGRTLQSCLGFLPTTLSLDEVTFMTLGWPHEVTEELVQEALSCKVKKLTLIQRCTCTTDAIRIILQCLEGAVPRAVTPPSEVLLQGFRLEDKEKEQFCRVKEHLESKGVKLRASECEVHVPRVDSLDEMVERLRTDTPRKELIVRSIKHVSQSIYTDCDACMKLFEKDLDWLRLGENHMNIFVKLLRRGFQSTLPHKIAVDVYGFQQFMGLALQLVKPERVELVFRKPASSGELGRVQDVITAGQGSVGWDHTDRRAYASYTGNIVEREPNLSATPFPGKE